MADTKKGKLIVFEGIDGSGKSTQANLLYETLLSKGYNVIFTREPGGTQLSEVLRNLVLQKDGPNISPVTEAYIFATARCQLIEEVIKPAIKAGAIVVLDRFLLSSIAYQGYGNEIGEENVLDINKVYMQGLKPDITFFLDCTRECARIRGEKDRIESASSAFYARVYEGYSRHSEDACVTKLDASLGIEELANIVLNKVQDKLNID